jgi:hypothetical protein
MQTIKKEVALKKTGDLDKHIERLKAETEAVVKADMKKFQEELLVKLMLVVGEAKLEGEAEEQLKEGIRKCFVV